MKKNNLIKISFVIPVHNEEKILKQNIAKILFFCESNSIEPEIVICENGSTDQTSNILKALEETSIKKYFFKERAFGTAYRTGIQNATNEIVYFTGIDFPFGYENVLDCYHCIGKNDLVFASKAHPDSIIRNSLKRKIASKIYQVAIRQILGLKIRDPQGCVMLRRSKILPNLEKCDAKDAFFSTQIAIYSQLSGCRMIEIPIVYSNPRLNSQFNVIKDGKEMLKQLFTEVWKINQAGYKQSK